MKVTEPSGSARAIASRWRGQVEVTLQVSNAVHQVAATVCSGVTVESRWRCTDAAKAAAVAGRKPRVTTVCWRLSSTRVGGMGTWVRSARAVASYHSGETINVDCTAARAAASAG